MAKNDVKNTIQKIKVLTFPEHLGSSPVFSGVRFAWSLIFCIVFLTSFLAIVLSVFFWFTASDYPFGILKLFY
jgi:hypothetical protein